MDVKSIVVEYLKAHKYDGLCLTNGCACLLEDFVPCGAISGKCRPGHRVNVSADAACWCDEIGTDHWHIKADDASAPDDRAAVADTVKLIVGNSGNDK